MSFPQPGRGPAAASGKGGGTVRSTSAAPADLPQENAMSLFQQIRLTHDLYPNRGWWHALRIGRRNWRVMR